MFSSFFTVHADAPEEKEEKEEPSQEEEAEEEPAQEEEEEEEPEDVRIDRRTHLFALAAAYVRVVDSPCPPLWRSASSRRSARPRCTTSSTARRRSTLARATRARTALRNCEYTSAFGDVVSANSAF